MDDEIELESGTGIDPVLAVLIAQLFNNGTLSEDDLANMRRRLDEGGDSHLAFALLGVELSADIDQPENRRAGMRVIDGGNSPD